MESYAKLSFVISFIYYFISNNKVVSFFPPKRKTLNRNAAMKNPTLCCQPTFPALVNFRLTTQRYVFFIYSIISLLPDDGSEMKAALTRICTPRDRVFQMLVLSVDLNQPNSNRATALGYFWTVLLI
jgi:hypothetical protein